MRFIFLNFFLCSQKKKSFLSKVFYWLNLMFTFKRFLKKSSIPSPPHPHFPRDCSLPSFSSPLAPSPYLPSLPHVEILSPLSVCPHWNISTPGQKTFLSTYLSNIVFTKR